MPNLVDPVTGGWGKVILDPLNSTQTTTLANLDTLGSLITAFATVANDDWRARFLKAATPSGRRAAEDDDRSDGGYRPRTVGRPEGRSMRCLTKPTRSRRMARGARRPSCPTCLFAPDDFALSLAFAGGGMYANGRFMFDADGNLWSGQNWMPGSQSGVIRASAAACSS